MKKVYVGAEWNTHGVISQQSKNMYEHFFSSRISGDMRKSDARKRLLEEHNLEPKQLVLPEQVHGDKVAIVTGADAGKQMRGVDGLVSNDSSIALGVLGADCVPMIFTDEKINIFGVAHAGWRGTLARIAVNVIEAMKTLGAQSCDISVTIGPHIGLCCYNVPKERAIRFKTKELRNNKWFIDLGKENILSLQEAGILPEHIQCANICTSCNSDYFSYRKDTKETFGEMLGVIAWK